MQRKIIFFTIFTYINCYQHSQNFYGPKPFSKLYIKFEKTLLNTTELIEDEGYVAEEHEVKTFDGYILKMHRIPHGVYKEKPSNIPVLLMHGIMSSSLDWVKNGPGKSLGYVLADSGYDVWMGNARGNCFSRKHDYLSLDDKEFWDFSFDEIGYYDLPVMVDHILEVTNRTKLHYIGHSEGATSFFAMVSEKPEYNSKILLMQGLAPLVYMSNSKSIALKIVARYLKYDKKNELIHYFGNGEFRPDLLAKIFCYESSPFMPLCLKVYLDLYGCDSLQSFKKDPIKVNLNYPASSFSRKQLLHLAKMFNTGKFEKMVTNLGDVTEKIGNKTLEYDLNEVTVPIALYYSVNDEFVHPSDMEDLYTQLRNPIKLHLVTELDFGHVDFTRSLNPAFLINILDLMKKYNGYIGENYNDDEDFYIIG